MSKPDKEKIEKEVRSQQKFSIGGAIGRAGRGLMKGASPVSLHDQVIIGLETWIEHNIVDPSGALKSLLKRKIRTAGRKDEFHPDKAVAILAGIIEKVLSSEYQFKEFVRQVDVRWGEMYQERPFFQREGKAPHVDDEYTFDSVRSELTRVLKILHNN